MANILFRNNDVPEVSKHFTPPIEGSYLNMKDAPDLPFKSPADGSAVLLKGIGLNQAHLQHLNNFEKDNAGIYKNTDFNHFSKNRLRSFLSPKNKNTNMKIIWTAFGVSAAIVSGFVFNNYNRKKIFIQNMIETEYNF